MPGRAVALGWSVWVRLPGAALTFGMTPLAIVDLMVDPIIDNLMGAADHVAGLDASDLGLAAAEPAALIPDLLAGLALPSDVVHDLDVAWVESPLGQLIDPIISAAAAALFGHDLIDNSIAGTVADPDAELGGLLFGDGEAGTGGGTRGGGGDGGTCGDTCGVRGSSDVRGDIAMG